MALPTITLDQQHAVNEHRRQGRTDRQIEKIIGLRYGLLATTYRVDCSAQVERDRAERARAEWREKDRRFWATNHYPDRILRGWRPTQDCVTSRPDAAPLRALPRKPRTQGAS